MDIQKLINAIADTGLRERSNYHATFGDLIDKLKSADDSLKLSPRIKGIGAYRGYYSDIALCTDQDGISIYKSGDRDRKNSEIKDWDAWYKENTADFEMPETPKKLAEVLESIIGKYFDGYKGGLNEITRDKPLWIATDYGDCSGLAVVEITNDLKLITKNIE